MCFFHTSVLEKYCKDKLAVYLFSAHIYQNHANLGKHGCLNGAK